tara:strand:+ start:80 stop:535 length:456 start_codon:yes stop_codon:yes gene_type:complete
MNTLHFDTKSFDPFAIGFRPMLEHLHKVNDQIGKVVPGYPPYNIEQTDENTYVIEMAVAGFGKSDVEIITEGDVLTVKGKIESDNKDVTVPGTEYLHKGISDRDFERKFTIADQVEVKNAEMYNGLLRVFLENIIPDHKKPRTVEVKDAKK